MIVAFRYYLVVNTLTLNVKTIDPIFFGRANSLSLSIGFKVQVGLSHLKMISQNRHLSSDVVGIDGATIDCSLA